MWYALPLPSGYLTRPGGDPELTRLPHGGVELTAEQVEILRADPTALWYRGGVVQPVDGAVVLADAKAAKRREVDAARDGHISAGFVHQFGDGPGTVQMRISRDVLNITGLGSAASVIAERGGTGPLVFHDAENAEHSMSPAQVLDMALAAQGHYSACYEASWAHKAAIEALADVAAVEGYDLSTGWP